VYDGVAFLNSLLKTQVGGRIVLSLKKSFLPAVPVLLRLVVLLPLCFAPAFAQKSASDDAALPKYDTQTEIKTKGIVDDLKLVSVGPNKEITELTVKSGSDMISVFTCPKSFEEEMGITIAKGDEVAVTGSKVKRDGADVILGREVIKGNDTLMLRDEKGVPVWTWHTKK
jgi:hypothetical protein